jgi:hypothetical protein
MSALWHFTCIDGHRAIGRIGQLRPQPHPLIGGVALVWLTDDPEPERDAVGLTSNFITCDRMAYRYRVIDKGAGVIPWSEFRPRLAAYEDTLAVLESYATPECWWVSRRPVAVVLDQIPAPASPSESGARKP